MGSKVSLQPKRLKKAEFAAICNNIDKQIFLDYYLNFILKYDIICKGCMFEFCFRPPKCIIGNF